MAPIDADVESVVSNAGQQQPQPKQDVEEEKIPNEKSGGVYASGDESRTSSLLSILEVLEKRAGVELRGCQPVPWAKRTVTQYVNIFTLWFSMSCNLLPITTGMVGTLSFGLGLRDASLVILFFTLLSTIPVAYMCTWGPRTGMRQLIQARFVYGKYFVSLFILLNLATLTGFSIVDSIIGGQALSAVSSGTTINATVGIVIIALLSLLVSFCGFKILHAYEKYAWVPALLAIVIATGCGGSQLKHQTVVEPATPQQVLSFGGLVASFMLPWAALASDFSTYMHPSAPPFRIALYTYVGLALPTILLMVLGAAIGGATPNIASWQAGYESNAASGVLAAMLEPAGGFGRFVTVLLAFSMVGNLSATMYSITLNFQMLLPWLFRVQRILFSVVITAIVIGVAIKAASAFFTNLENFLGLIGYWAAAFIGVVVTDHVWFRGGKFAAYTEDEAMWDEAGKLPVGWAAMAASVGCFGLVVPCMYQIWFTGPIAERTGDLGFEVALVLSAGLYVPLRYLEKRICGR